MSDLTIAISLCGFIIFYFLKMSTPTHIIHRKYIVYKYRSYLKDP